jgi:hypothetical protein
MLIALPLIGLQRRSPRRKKPLRPCRLPAVSSRIGLPRHYATTTTTTKTAAAAQAAAAVAVPPSDLLRRRHRRRRRHPRGNDPGRLHRRRPRGAALALRRAARGPRRRLRQAARMDPRPLRPPRRSAARRPPPGATTSLCLVAAALLPWRPRPLQRMLRRTRSHRIRTLRKGFPLAECCSRRRRPLRPRVHGRPCRCLLRQRRRRRGNWRRLGNWRHRSRLVRQSRRLPRRKGARSRRRQRRAGGRLGRPLRRSLLGRRYLRCGAARGCSSSSSTRVRLN